MERVSIIEGKTPCIFVAPHGHPSDDINTGIIATAAAEALDACAVINNGWKRGKNYDYYKEICNCNNVAHLIDVPKDEFLEPIIRFKNRIRKKHTEAYIFYIHGMANSACDIVNDESLCMIVGWGNGKPASHTCQEWMKNFLVYQCHQYGWTTYEGSSGGDYAAWSKNNLTQFFRKHRPDSSVHSMQLEIIYALRDGKAKAQLCGECLADFIKEVINYSSWNQPDDFTIKQF